MFYCVIRYYILLLKSFKIKIQRLFCTNEGGGLLVEHSTGQQVEVILHRVHNHRVTCIVASLQK